MTVFSDQLVDPNLQLHSFLVHFFLLINNFSLISGSPCMHFLSKRHRGWVETHPGVPMTREKLEELHRTIQLRLRAWRLSQIKAQQQVK